jgi:hypothetical protein
MAAEKNDKIHILGVWLLLMVRIINSKLKTQNSKLKTQNAE